ncbi:hypothetical protein Pmani_025482 [Petrolisthes manimaculis]|uniref:Uncharacterized protein n=1 Tax=Petrolisthes manimaculis TaxID=1843537 RepID=A0AAE1TYV9_9EUCA|nr:hypothetical protein Pmani_025482 [Petrolisthes manimaculis]
MDSSKLKHKTAVILNDSISWHNLEDSTFSDNLTSHKGSGSWAVSVLFLHGSLFSPDPHPPTHLNCRNVWPLQHSASPPSLPPSQHLLKPTPVPLTTNTTTHVIYVTDTTTTTIHKGDERFKVHRYSYTSIIGSNLCCGSH